jgi:hypothetical protein
MIEAAGMAVSLAGYVCPTTTPVFAGADSGGVMPIDLGVIGRDLRTARTSGATRCVVCLHWGTEEVSYPRPEDIEIAHRVVELGADLVVGHHAHCVQPFEVYRGKHVFYGLGNAIMPDLDVASYYDASGAPTSRFVKKQHGWNRRSLAVDYAPADGRVRCRALRSKGMTLGEQVLPFPRMFRILPATTAGGHSRNYGRAVGWLRIRGMIYRFLAQPKMPRWCHLRAALGAGD